MTSVNPILKADFPDPDVIRVGGVYYMVSTTMHFMPGGAVLRSTDLIHWELASYLFESLDNTPAQCLSGAQNIYGKGMWAGSLRYHGGVFHVCFIAPDTRKTYLFRSENVEGPWRRSEIQGFYYDSSLLFDDDGRVYIAHGNTEIRVTELSDDLSGPKPGGFDRVVVRDTGNVSLGYEGSHFYKINGRYYLFFIHWPKDGNRRRTEACFAADSLESGFTGGDILDDDLGYRNQGVAQGGVVDTPDGDWYAVLFQDRGAVGRIPVLVPMRWENGFPVLGNAGAVPSIVETKSTGAAPEGAAAAPLFGSDDFRSARDAAGNCRPKNFWQWNHTPDASLWSVRPGCYRIRSGKISQNVSQAVNTLTQRMAFPACTADVTVDGSAMNDGDFAGLCALQGCYGLIALTRQEGRYHLEVLVREPEGDPVWGKLPDEGPGRCVARIPVQSPVVTLRLRARFVEQADEAEFLLFENGKWVNTGVRKELYFKLDHFTGCRFGLFLYSTVQTGGTADFSNFVYAAGV